jgi:chromosome partitioning protein
LIANEFQDQDLIVIDCTPTESIFTSVAYHASRYVLVPVRPEFFATIGFPLLNDSLETFRNNNRGHQIDVIGIVVNNSTYDGGNDGGPEKATSMGDIRREAQENGWHLFQNELGFSRGFPKMMRGNYNWLGNAPADFRTLAHEMFQVPELRGLRR